MILSQVVYHCSPVKIDQFYIPENGLHFGSLESALIAAARHVVNQDEMKVFVHKVKINVTKCQELFDVGFNWAEEVNHETCKIFRYKNKYEPSLQPSYVLFDTSLILSIEQVYSYLITREDYDEFE